MKTKTKWGLGRWLLTLIVLAAIAGGYYAVTQMGVLSQFGIGSTQTAAAPTGAASLPTVEIQSVDVLQTEVSASGNLTLVSERSVALAVDGIVHEILADVGDQVAAGDVLLRLDTTDLERDLALAQLSVENAKLSLADVQEPATRAELAQAEAALQEAQANLADVRAGPSDAEIAAARSSLAASQSSYAELAAGPSDAELTQLSADLKKAEIALAEAQSAYDKVAWQGNASSQSADLQSATIDYESAKAAYTESTAAASNSDLQNAAANIQSAQVSLDDLLNSPTDAEIATAEAQLVDAEATLAELRTGASANALRAAEITLQQALIDLESAQRNLAAGTLAAPISGVVTSVDAEMGVRKSADSIVVTLTDPTQLDLMINVAESDIPNVALDQTATVEIDALPGQSFRGVVAAISPVNDSASTSISYPVTVRLADDNLDGVRPGMNAVAILSSQQAVAADSWLVPTNALRSAGEGSAVTVVRDEQPVQISVTAGAIQGEWTTVSSAELQAGDLVVGSLSTSDEDGGFMMGGPPSGMPLGGGMPMSGGGRP